MSAYFEHKTLPNPAPKPITDAVQVALRKRVDAVMSLAYRHGVRVHIKLRIPEEAP